jgi:hypothetical protein
MRIGIYRWWCGGLADEGDGPEVQPPSGPDHYDILCASCRRLAPFQNGCRWVTDEEWQRLYTLYNAPHESH